MKEQLAELIMQELKIEQLTHMVRGARLIIENSLPLRDFDELARQFLEDSKNV